MPKRGRKDIHRFCGWDELCRFLAKCNKPIKGALFATLFQSGARISEALEFHSDMFQRVETANGPKIIIYGAKVLKKRRQESRNIPMPLTEKLVVPMMNWVEEQDGYLFPGVTPGQAYWWIKRTDPAWWLHRIRSERATQLVIEYGFGVADLMKFFDWSRAETAMQYVRLSVEDIGKKMV